MKKTIIVFVWLLLIRQAGWSQSNEQIPQFLSMGKDSSYIGYFAKRLEFPQELVDCYKSRLLIALKFKLDAQGKVTAIETVGDLKDSTQEYLKSLVRNTSGHWKPRMVNGKAVASKWMILPILFKVDSDECNSKSQGATLAYLDPSIYQVFDLLEDNDCTVLHLCTVSYLNQQ